VLTFAKLTGDLLSPSFDHAMLHLQRLPFLEEEPPHEFDVLTARDVMNKSVVVLREVETVADILAVLRRTEHNGFPIVDIDERGVYFAGLILRRQLLVLLSERVWRLQEQGVFELPPASRDRFVDSAFARLASLDGLGEDEQEKRIDLRPFFDPSPYVVTELMPLRRVYRLFNQIGVRHLTVIDHREQVVGMITRKDILPHAIEHHVLSAPVPPLTRSPSAAGRVFAAFLPGMTVASDYSDHPPGSKAIACSTSSSTSSPDDTTQWTVRQTRQGPFASAPAALVPTSKSKPPPTPARV